MASYISDYTGRQIDDVIGLFHLKGLDNVVGVVERNSDGTFGNIHYEIGDFPKDVPVTDFRNYDIEARHPDAIYIHNPYDDRNFVTSVHPDYYSSKLKDLTD